MMSWNLTTIDQAARLLDAVLLMRSSGYRHLPVMNGEKLVGLLSDRDVHRAAPSVLENITPEEYNQFFETTPITKVMTREPVTVGPEAPVSDVVQLMYERKFGCIPVVEGDNKLIGLVTTTDLLGLLHQMLSES
jgi:CBS domain-containing protein